MTKSQKESVEILGFYSKYPMKQESRKNKDVVWEGSLVDMPTKYIGLATRLKLEHKYAMVYFPNKEVN